MKLGLFLFTFEDFLSSILVHYLISIFMTVFIYHDDYFLINRASHTHRNTLYFVERVSVIKYKEELGLVCNDYEFFMDLTA